MKTDEKNKARELRSQGVSIKKISKQLSVSASSVGIWVKDIILTEEQLEKLKNQNPIYNKQMGGAKAREEKARSLRKQYQQEGKIKAKEGNLLHQAGCMLYWGEGAKSRYTCTLVNSDLNMLKLFVKFLKECFVVKNEKIRVRINCYTGNKLSVQDIEKYWQDNLDLPSSCFTKTTADNLPKSSKNKKSKNKLLYGTVSISTHQVSIIQHIYGAIQEYAGFNNDYCLG